MWPNTQFPTDLVTFTEEIVNGKLHFLCSVESTVTEIFLSNVPDCWSQGHQNRALCYNNSWRVVYYLWTYCVVRKMKFSIKIFLASANQIVDSGRFVPLLTKKNITENFFAALQSCVKHFFSNPNTAFPLYKKWCLPLRISSFFVQCPMPQKVLWYTLGCGHHTRFLVYFKL